MFVTRVFLLMGLVGLLAGCGNPQQQSARVLQSRLQANLSPQLANHQAAISDLPDGAQVMLDESALFVPNRADLTTDGTYLVASATESLLDPRLMQVDVVDTSALSDDLRSARERSVQGYIEANQLGPTLPVGTRPQPTTAVGTSPALVVTIHVQCPPGPQGSTWGYPNRAATCN